MKNQSRILILALSILLICRQGYCLFPEQIDSQQVISAIKFQRQKDKNRKNQTQKVKDPQQLQELPDQAQPGDGNYTSTENIKKGITQRSIENKSQELRAVVQYKRHTRDGQIAATPAPIPVAQPVAAKEEENSSGRGWIIFLTVLGAAAILSYKRQKE